MAALFDDYTALETGGPGPSKDEKDAILASLLPPEYRALLRTISGSESNYGGGVDPYRVMYGGKQIQDFGDHPRVKIPIVSSSPNYGKYTTAAGGYQFLGSSWDEAKKALNLPDFSPESQDRAAIWHAENTYKAKTGRNLQDDIAKAQGKPAQLSDIGRALSGWWTSLPGGIEHNAATNSFGTRFAKELNSPDAYGGPALYGPDAPISNDIPTKARYASASGTDVPPVARNLRNSNMPSGMPAIMGGGGGENDMPSLLRGGISALQDPETMAYLQMIVKGLNPWSSLDPNKALANAQHLNMQREEARRAQSNTDRAYRLQERQANEPQTITRPDGSIVQIPKVGTGAGAPNQVLPAVNSPTEAAKIADELDYKPGTPERTQFLKDFYMKKTSTDDLIEYNQAKKEGFAGTLEQWMAQKRSTAGKYNLNPVYGSKNGQPVLLQTGNMGEAVETKLPEGVTVGKEPIKLDTGTSFILIDPVTRQYIKEIPKNVAEKERQEKVGQATGEGQVALPTVVSTAERMLSQIENVQKHPGRDLGTGAIFGRVPGIAGQQLDFVERMDQLKGGAFLQAFQILKGGGAITETEGTKGTTAIARLNRAKSAADIDAALNDLKDVIQGGVKNARIKAGLPAGSEQSQPATSLPPPPSGFKIVP